MGYRGAKQGHNAIAGELIDGSLILVDFIHEDLETTVHNLVDFLGVDLLWHGSVVGHICKKDRHQLSFALDGAAGGQDLVGKKFGGVWLGHGIVYKKGFFGLY